MDPLTWTRQRRDAVASSKVLASGGLGFSLSECLVGRGREVGLSLLALIETVVAPIDRLRAGFHLQRTREKWDSHGGEEFPPFNGVGRGMEIVGIEDEIVAFAVAPRLGNAESEAGGFEGEG
jgi:hypothetical protein